MSYNLDLLDHLLFTSRILSGLGFEYNPSTCTSASSTALNTAYVHLCTLLYNTLGLILITNNSFCTKLCTKHTLSRSNIYTILVPGNNFQKELKALSESSRLKQPSRLLWPSRLSKALSVLTIVLRGSTILTLPLSRRSAFRITVGNCHHPINSFRMISKIA
jgi:hypothetical protein